MFELSVILPTKNDGDALLKTLMGLERSTHATFEAIVVVDGPGSIATDGVLMLASSIMGPRLRVVRGPAVGFGAAVNRGVALARGRNVCVLREDVHPLDGALDSAIDQLDATDDDNAILALLAEPAVGADLATTLDIDGITYATSHVRGTLVADFPLARRQTFAATPFDASLKTSAATTDFSLRAWATGHTITAATSCALISHETRLRDEQARVAETMSLIASLPATRTKFNIKSPCTLERATARRAA